MPTEAPPKPAPSVTHNRETLEKMMESLRSRRAPWLRTWRDCGELVLPWAHIQTPGENTPSNRGRRKNQAILNSTPILALQTWAAGLQSALTPASRPWVAMTLEERDLAEDDENAAWLDYHTQAILDYLSRGNFYDKIYQHYLDAGGFGTPVTEMEEDLDSVVRFQQVPNGTCFLSRNEKGEYDTCFRELKRNTETLVESYGRMADGTIDFTHLGPEVKDAWEKKDYYKDWDVVRAVLPRRLYKPNSPFGKDMPFKSCWWMAGRKDLGFFHESGFQVFPYLISPIGGTDADDYATSWPTLNAQGDIQELYELQKNQNQAIAKEIKPPTTGPAALKRKAEAINLDAGGFTPEEVGTGDPKAGLRPVYQLRFNHIPLNDKINKTEAMINRAFSSDLFLMLALMDRKDRTATEIMEMKEEKLLALGPIAQVFMKTLRHLFRFMWQAMLNQGRVLPAPKKMAEASLRPDFLNLFEMAQRAAGLGGLDRLILYTERIANVEKAWGINETQFKVNLAQGFDVLQRALNLPAELVNSDETAAELKKQAQEAAQAAQRAAMVEQLAKTGKTLSETRVQGESALDQLVDQSRAGTIA